MFVSIHIVLNELRRQRVLQCDKSGHDSLTGDKAVFDLAQ